jgi:hypothetical protein
MERRTFLLGLIGSLTAASLAPALAAPSYALSFEPKTPPESAEAGEISPEDLDEVGTDYAQYYRRRGRRVYRRYVRRPYRRTRRRVRRYMRRGRWYYY